MIGDSHPGAEGVDINNRMIMHVCPLIVLFIERISACYLFFYRAFYHL